MRASIVGLLFMEKGNRDGARKKLGTSSVRPSLLSRPISDNVAGVIYLRENATRVLLLSQREQL
jgi:hypothetical protein